MFGFPVNLQDSGVQKFTNDADNGFPKIQQREIFYSVKNGNWTDLNTWQTASGRVGLLPTANDDVYIRNIVTFVGVQATYNCNNLFNSGTINWAANVGQIITLNVFGNINSIGTINLKVTSSFAYLTLYGVNNFISTFTTDLTGLFTYARNGNQDLLDLPYSNLTISGSGIKKPTNNLVVNNNLIVSSGSELDLWWYDSIINGISQIFGTLSKSYFGNILFVGALNGSGGSRLDLSKGNPNVELRGGISSNGFQPTFSGGFITGIGTWTFTTNNQSIIAFQNVTLSFDCPIIISGAITLTNAPGNNFTMSLNNTINGNNAASKFTQGLNAITNFATIASVSSMTTGIFDFTTNANTIGYTGNYTATIPSYFNTFHNLVISGTGIKSLGVNTTTNGNLDLRGNNIQSNAGILECGIYNLSVFGQSFVGSDFGKAASLRKSSSGNILFVGLLSTSNTNDNITFTGNPNVEMRGGINVQFGSTFTSGTGTYTFTTNNQSIGATNNLSFLGNVFISGAITITNTSQVSIYGTLDGNNVNSKWLLNSILDLYNLTPPFATLGILDYTTNTNASIGFRYNGSGTLPGTTFQGLRIGGTGTKTLAGNTLVQRVLDLIGNISGTPGTEGILECSTFNLQIDGITNAGSDLGKGATLSKNGAGNIIFGGYLSTSNGGDRILLTGNPTMEFRGGITLSSGGNNWGTGLVTFSTNNQTCIFQNFITFNQNILISGAIIIDVSNFITNGSINGNNASSTLRQSTNSTLTYRNATQPMATGILDTSTNLNTWIYGNLNQDIKGSPTISPKQVYRNLTLNGTGVKTLQGYVSVLNTYTLTAPATLANNGFTLTNP